MDYIVYHIRSYPVQAHCMKGGLTTITPASFLYITSLLKCVSLIHTGKKLVLVIPKVKHTKVPIAAKQKTEDDSGCDSGD